MYGRIICGITTEKNTDYKVTGSLWIACEGERFFGPGRVELLQKIEETGSINKAAKQMHMSYKKAWEMINALNAQAAKPFVITQAGGEKGEALLLQHMQKSLLPIINSYASGLKHFLKKKASG